MKRFVFRFQHILNVKQSIEKAQEAALGEALTALSREQEILVRLEQTRKQGKRAGNTLQTARVRVSLLEVNASYLQRLERQMGEQQQYTRRLAAVVEQRRQKLLEATQERRVFQRLKEKTWDAYRREENRQRGIHLDEVGKQLHLRRAAEDAAW